MNKPEFDFSEFVQVPDMWIENALNIPNTAQDIPKAAPPKRRYLTAASIILITVLGFSVYFLFGNKTPIPVTQNPTFATAETHETAPTQSQTTDIIPTEPTPASDETVQPSKPAPTAIATELSTDSEGSVIVITTITTYHNESTDAPEAPTSEAPHETPTQKPYVKPTSPPTPTQQPTKGQSSMAEGEPGDPQSEQPTLPYTPDIRTLKVILPIREYSICEDDETTLYCCIYDSSGKTLGDSNLYSSSHQLELVPISAGDSYQSGEVGYLYTVDYDLNQVPDNRFTYKIYLRDGTVIQEGEV